MIWLTLTALALAVVAVGIWFGICAVLAFPVQWLWGFAFPSRPMPWVIAWSICLVATALVRVEHVPV